MALEISKMSLMAYTGANGGHHLYWYSNTEADDVTAANYFDDFVAQLREGDIIVDIAGAMMYIVSDIDDGEVTVAAMFDAPAE
jgi:hypothetical protein